MIKGSIVALVTPMTQSGEIDLEALSGLLEWHIAEGTDAVVAVGTTGESPTLDVSEHCQVIEHVIKTVKGRIPVIAGTGANSTSEAIELTETAHKAGADACLLVTPYYNKPTQKGLYEHYKAIAGAVNIPQILYNVPSRTGCDLRPETVKKLTAVENIVGIKEATGDINRGREVITLCQSDEFSVYSGDDPTALQLMKLGARGNISVTANVAPGLVHELCSLALAGKWREAAVIEERLAVLNKALFVESNPIPVKWALKEMGRISGGLRLPLTELDQLYHEILHSALARVDLL